LGSGKTDTGDQGRIRKPGQPAVKRSARTDGVPEPRIETPNTVGTRRPGISGAMSQQCGDSGNFSTPQKFVQLVGCRDPKARPEPWVRPGPAKP
jgi:hypothetical protein